MFIYILQGEENQLTGTVKHNLAEMLNYSQ